MHMEPTISRESCVWPSWHHLGRRCTVDEGWRETTGVRYRSFLERNPHGTPLGFLSQTSGKYGTGNESCSCSST